MSYHPIHTILCTYGTESQNRKQLRSYLFHFLNLCYFGTVAKLSVCVCVCVYLRTYIHVFLIIHIKNKEIKVEKGN